MQDTNLSDNYYKEALLKYAQSYIAKKRKSPTEKELEGDSRKFVIYARKSTEDDQRQVQSIGDQIEQCVKYAKSNNLEVVEIIREEKSAKIAGKRPRFDEMIVRLYKGDFYNAVLAWHPDRLSRNMKESGEILDMLDNDFITDLKFPSYTFNNDAAGKMTLSILFAMAKEFSDKLSEDTIRGNKKKVSEGKYMGSRKRGYINTEEDYFRPHPDTFNPYREAWQMYIEENNQTKVAKWLHEQGEEISSNMMSEFFRDPFFAGIYCYGDQVVDLTTVDPKFRPMVSAKEFLETQRADKAGPSGWRLSEAFRPFNNLMICGDCGNIMTSGVSEGNVDRYLNITCGNKNCKQKRREEGKRPIANTIRGKEVIFLYEDALKQLKSVPENIYLKTRTKYLAHGNTLISGYTQEVAKLNAKLTKLKTKEKKLSNEILDQTVIELKQKFSEELQLVIKEVSSLELAMEKLRSKKAELEYQIVDDFPPYEDFLNFFEKASAAIKNTTDAYLTDQLVKMVFVNIEVKDKKISQYWLREPFDQYKALNLLSGVEKLAPSEHYSRINFPSLQLIKQVIESYSQLISDHLAGVNVEAIHYKL